MEKAYRPRPLPEISIVKLAVIWASTVPDSGTAIDSSCTLAVEVIVMLPFAVVPIYLVVTQSGAPVPLDCNNWPAVPAEVNAKLVGPPYATAPGTTVLIPVPPLVTGNTP